MWKRLTLVLCVAAVGACTTTSEPTSPPIAAPTPSGPPPADSQPEIPSEIPSEIPPVLEPAPTPLPNPVPSVPSFPSAPPINDVPLSYEFSKLNYWQTTDTSAALSAFKKTCAAWENKPDEAWLNPKIPRYGQYKDWREVCLSLPQGSVDRNIAARYFQSNFKPLEIGGDDGLLTAYYSPQIDVRRRADDEYSEPILALPTDPQIQNLPRKDINAFSSAVLAYGRPIDVFFLQIQGSGQIKFQDGTVFRAAYAGHNSKTYKSIGSVLIARGELTKDKASKQDIEDWMVRSGREKTRALMNENPRYIFFKTEYVVLGEGPKGSAGLPLTSMGSLAIDPRYHPYGALIWLEGRFPDRAGDYIGQEGGLLVVAQDMGGAIKGSMRGDVFFGIGDEAGARAGVMKHKAKWTIFLPNALALTGLLVS